jgi:ParB-like chromosome segregation protein Spo0J
MGYGQSKTPESEVPAPQGEANKIAESLLPLVTDIDSLVPDPDNARVHGERNMQAIQHSLAKFGQVKPIVVRQSTRVVLAGNGTLAAARSLGWTKIAASFVEMSDADAAAYGLADNRTAELAAWDFEVVARLEKLINEGKEVREAGMVGWSHDEILALRLEDSYDAEDQSASLPETYNVLVVCGTEEKQLALIEQLMRNGWDCKALSF